MSLEETLESIDKNIEKIVEMMSRVKKDEPLVMVTKDNVQVQTVPCPPPPSVIKEVKMTAKQLDDAVSIEFERIGGDDTTPIFNIIKKYGADTLSSLDPSNYNAVLTEIKNVK